MFLLIRMSIINMRLQYNILWWKKCNYDIRRNINIILYQLSHIIILYYVNLFVHWFDHWFVLLFICSFIDWFIYLFIYLFIILFFYLLFYLFIYLLINLPTHSFIYFFLRSAHSLYYWWRDQGLAEEGEAIIPQIFIFICREF